MLIHTILSLWLHTINQTKRHSIAPLFSPLPYLLVAITSYFAMLFYWDNLIFYYMFCLFYYYVLMIGLPLPLWGKTSLSSSFAAGPSRIIAAATLSTTAPRPAFIAAAVARTVDRGADLGQRIEVGGLPDQRPVLQPRAEVGIPGLPVHFLATDVHECSGVIRTGGSKVTVADVSRHSAASIGSRTASHSRPEITAACTNRWRTCRVASRRRALIQRVMPGSGR